MCEYTNPVVARVPLQLQQKANPRCTFGVRFCMLGRTPGLRTLWMCLPVSRCFSLDSERPRAGLARLETKLQGYAQSAALQQGELALAGNQFFFRSAIHPTNNARRQTTTHFLQQYHHHHHVLPRPGHLRSHFLFLLETHFSTLSLLVGKRTQNTDQPTYLHNRSSSTTPPSTYTSTQTVIMSVVGKSRLSPAATDSPNSSHILT